MRIRYFAVIFIVAGLAITVSAKRKKAAAGAAGDHGSAIHFDAPLFSPDGKILAARNVTYEFWDVDSGKKLDLPAFRGEPQFTADSKLAAFVNDYKSSLYDFAAAKPLKLNDGNVGQELLGFSPDGKIQLLRVTGREIHSDTLAIQPLSAPFVGEKSQKLTHLKGSGFDGGFAFSPDSSKLVLRTTRKKNKEEAKTTLYDTGTGQRITDLQVEPLHQDEDSTLKWSADSSRVAICCDEWIDLFDGHTGGATGTVKLAAGESIEHESMAISPDGKFVVAEVRVASTTSRPGGADTGRFYSATTGKLVATLQRCVGYEHDFYFSADGKFVTTIGGSVLKKIPEPTEMDTVFRWSVPGGAAQAFRLPHEIVQNLTASYCFTQDINTVAVCCNDGTIKIWKVGGGPTVTKVLGTALHAPTPSAPKYKAIPDGSKIVLSGSRVYLETADRKRTPCPDGIYMYRNHALVVRDGQKAIVNN